MADMSYYFSYYFSKWSGAEACGFALWQVWAINLALCALLAISAYTDGTRGKILNIVTFPCMLAGIVLNGAFGVISGAGAVGLLWALLGWTVGMGIQWVPYMLRFAKAGDVKLLAAVGALKGWAFCTFGFLYGAAAFGVLVLPYLYMRGELGAVGGTIKGYAATAVMTQSAPDVPAPVTRRRYVPWGVGLAIGFFIALALETLHGRPLPFAS